MGSITRSNPFPPLPTEFRGPYLALRFRYYYNPDKADLRVIPGSNLFLSRLIKSLTAPWR